MFAAVRTRQIILVPVTDSTRLIGGVVAAVVDEHNFNVENINLMKSLSYAAGLALERITLIGAIAEKTIALRLSWKASPRGCSSLTMMIKEPSGTRRSQELTRSTPPRSSTRKRKSCLG